MGPKAMKTAADIMTTHVVSFAPEMPVEAAARALLRKRFSGAPVLGRDGAILGVFSEEDAIATLARALYEGWPGGTVAEHMTATAQVVSPRDDLATLATQFEKCHHRRLLVSEGNSLLGLVTRRDLLAALYDAVSPAAPPTTYELISRSRGQ